jgi:hypothetical protein
MENESIGKRGMGINYKGSQGQTERAVVLLEEEEDGTSCTMFINWLCEHNNPQCDKMLESQPYNFFDSPTDAQLNCLKNNFIIYIKTAPTCFGSITIIRERTIRAC